jgi:acetyl-CoA decarbonylase/synthase complex subunit gamma
LILPQLSGPGVSAHEVKRLSGFKVIYGPIRAADLPNFLDAGLKATPEMRLKTFTTRERFVLIPVEIIAALKAGIITIAILFLLSLLGRAGQTWVMALSHGLFTGLAVLTAILAGAVLTPLLLPWLPGRAFSVKGLSLGLLSAAILLVFRWGDWTTMANSLEILAWLLLIPASHLSRNEF